MALSRTPSFDSPVREQPAGEPPLSRLRSLVENEHWRGRLKALWIEACQDVVADLRSGRWRRFLVICWTAGLLLAMILFPSTIRYTSYGNYGSSTCRPDGAFDPFLRTYDPWGIAGFFQITMGYGSLSFTQAKLIDVIWDIGVGRVGQALLAICSWKAFSAYVRCCIDHAPITYDTYWTIFMSDEPSLMGTVHMMRDFSTRRGLRSKLAMVFIVLTMAFVLAVPTLAGAMTGYAQNSEAFVADTNGNMYSITQLHATVYSIHDGWRVGFDGDHAVPWVASGSYYSDWSLLLYEGAWGISLGSDCESVYNSQEETQLCLLQQGISQYVQKYGFFGLDANGRANNIESVFMNKTLPEPTLNISATYLLPNAGVFGGDWKDPRTGLRPFSNRSSMSFKGPANESFSIDYVLENGSCAEVGTYKWGFSFLQLFIALLFLLLWTLGISAMSLTAHSSLALRKGVEVPEKYRAAFMLALAMQQEFNELDKTPEKLTEAQIENYINTRLSGGRMTLRSAFPEPPQSLLRVTKEWVKRDKWWLTVMSGLTLLVATCWMSAFDSPDTMNIYWLLVCATAGVHFAVVVGRTRKSRLFIACFGGLLGIVLALVFAIVVYTEGYY